MKASKIIIPIILVATLCMSWFTFVSGTVSSYTNYRACTDEAEKSIESGLYEQAIEYYKKSLEYKRSEETYQKIKESYDKLYEEEHTAFVRNLYLEDMAIASTEFPKNALFWEKQIELEQNRCATALAGHRAEILFNGDLLKLVAKLL
jgi:tetratricopeptide (TPR) repeat protein